MPVLLAFLTPHRSRRHRNPARPHRGIRLLPYFDAYVVAGQPRKRLYPGAAAARALTPAGQAGNYPVLLVDGDDPAR